MRIKAIALSAAVISAVGRLSALFAAPTLVYPVENAEVKTVGDKIWNEIHNDAVYLKQATFYQETYTSAYRQSAMREVSTNSLPIVFRWSGASGASVVKAWRTRDLAADQSAAPVFAATTTGTSVTYWDPEVGRDFTWTVEDSSGRATGHFHTAQRAPRIIYADHDPVAAGAACTAGRDLGGWLTADGTKKVRQGLVYRSAALEYCSPGESENLYKPLDYLQDTLGIRLDLDLRTVAHLEKYWIGAKGWNCEWKNGAKLTITESNIGPLVERYCVDSDYAEFPSYTGFTSSVANKKAVWAAFGKIYNSVVVKGEPVIFHCSHGKDRTGSLAYVLLGALGVSEPDARRDFGFTWYLEAKDDTYMGTDGTDGYDGLTLLLNALPAGETFQARCVAYLAACGSAAADSGAAAKIAAFQSAMLEDVEHAEDAYELPATDAFVYNELYWHRVNGGGSFGSEYNGTVASKKGKLSYWYPTYSSTTQYTVPATSLDYNACYYFWPIKDYAYASPSCSYYKAGKIVTVCKSNSYTIDVYGLKAYFTDVDHSVGDRTIIEHREGVAKFDNFDIYFTKYDRTTTKSDGTLMYGGETGNKTLESVYSGVGSIDVWANATLRVSDIRDMCHYATHASIKGQYKAYVRFPEGNCAEARFEAEGGDKPDNILGWFTGGEAGTRQYVKVDNAFLMFKKSGIVNGVAGSLGLEFALGSSNTTSTAAMLQIGGSLKVNAGSTISVDAGGKGAGTYKLISVSGTFTDGAGLTSRSNYSVVNCASGHYGTITKSSTGKTVYVKIQKGEDPGSGGSSGEPAHDDTGTVDVAASTYTWRGYTGPWEQPTNWTASASGTYGIPAHGTYATADFPATLDGAFACTLGESLAVDKVEFNSPNMTFVVDGARLDVNGKVDDYAAYDFGDGEYDNATIELKGPGAMIVSSAARTRANFGCRHDGFTPKGVCIVRFVVPAAGWESEPRIKAVGVDSKVVFYSNSRLEIDATALGVPEEGETKSVLLASGTGDNGVYVGSMATNIVCAAGAKGAIKVESQMLVLEVVADSTFQPEEPSSDIEAEWGYVKRGLGTFGNEVAVVFTNHTAEAMTWTVPADLTNVQFLVVGGGGGGGGDNCASDGCVGGGGGGGGGVVTGLVYSIAKDAVVTVSVGAGGAGGTAGKQPGTTSYNYYGGGKIGSNSSFAVGGITYVTAKGGGRDLGVGKTTSSGTRYQGGQGGSSAGSRAKKTTQGDATQGEIGSGAANLLEAVLFGNKGGAGDSTIEYASAGGGGATESGHSPESSSQGGKGGEGLLSEITGTAEVYGSGGGGGTALTAGVGGAGGTNAGDGHRTGKANGENGVANRGGGGGGGGGQANGGSGGSGIVVFRYVEQILPRVGDDEAGVEIDKVFDVARVSKPIVYPSRPVLRDEDGQQQIVFGGRAVDVPTYYTAALAETAGGFEVSLQLNDRARPVIADGEGDEAPAKALVIEDGVVKIHLENVHSGLYYRLERSTEIGDGADWSEVSEWQRAGEFSSPLGSDPTAFYKVIVSDEPSAGD